jgi:AcrR family transcriptional regulator
MKMREATRAGIMRAARRIATRKGSTHLSLRSVALEAGFAPAALYVYFRNKDELMLALATEDLAGIARQVQATGRRDGKAIGPRSAASAVFAFLSKTETLAAAASALNAQAKSRAARLFNGRLIAALAALSKATGTPAESREGQLDVLLMAATLAGLAVLARTGRLDVLGFTPDEVLARLPQLAGRT